MRWMLLLEAVFEAALVLGWLGRFFIVLLVYAASLVILGIRSPDALLTWLVVLSVISYLIVVILI